MKDTYFICKFTSKKVIRVLSFTSFILTGDNCFQLFKNGEFYSNLNIVKRSSLNELYFYDLTFDDEFIYGISYQINIIGFGLFDIDCNDAIDFEGFDDDYFYKGDDLGPTYTKKATTFKLWAPLASEVYLVIYSNNIEKLHPMNRYRQGIYCLTLDGNFKNVSYCFILINSGKTTRALDPYAKGTSLDGRYSVVIDTETFLKKTKKPMFNKNKTMVESSIYECSIRDLTSSPFTNISNKGKYLGITEKGKKSKDNLPAGIDHIKNLGVSHVQLLPILDFGRIKNDKDNFNYDWGYDVLSFFTLEGSYSLHPENPDERLYEFKKVVDAFHEEGIGVIVDVVYNHIFEFEKSSLEAILPGYYFRRIKNAKYSNASGCGNDVATEKNMVRKIIVDSVNYLLDMFDIDGIRIDLMGLIDIDTINEISKTTRAKKPNFFIYGEGWDMCNELKQEKKSVITNSNLLPNVSFFNDSFRDIVRGNSFDLGKKGYCSGDYSYADGNIYAMLGSVINYTYLPRFVNANQSINYVECHDNHTLFDKLEHSNKEEDTQIRLKRIKLANSIVAFSFGVPFFHMGQEYGATKYGKGNTYIAGDKYNQLDYKLLNKRLEIFNVTKEALKLRKKLPFLSLSNPNAIDKIVFPEVKNNGVIFLKIKNKKYLMENYKEIILISNPSNFDYFLPINETYKTLFSSEDFPKTVKKNLILPPTSFLILGSKEK